MEYRLYLSYIDLCQIRTYSSVQEVRISEREILKVLHSAVYTG
jgi:hypothetical protein